MIWKGILRTFNQTHNQHTGVISCFVTLINRDLNFTKRKLFLLCLDPCRDVIGRSDHGHLHLRVLCVILAVVKLYKLFCCLILTRMAYHV
jgi:hypothetical protein